MIAGLLFFVNIKTDFIPGKDNFSQSTEATLFFIAVDRTAIKTWFGAGAQPGRKALGIIKNRPLT